VNAVSPEPVTNADFTRALARALGRPAVLPTPAFAVELLFGEMGCEVLLTSTRVRPARLLESGFEFCFPQLDAVFKQALDAFQQTT
jgi:NAD dependent epimerase/dehydratase family enzyme